MMKIVRVLSFIFTSISSISVPSKFQKYLIQLYFILSLFHSSWSDLSTLFDYIDLIHLTIFMNFFTY